jgi:hypothetical protein
MSGLSGCPESLPLEAARDSCNFSSFGTVMGHGRGLSSCIMTTASLLPGIGMFSKPLFFDVNFAVVEVEVAEEEGEEGKGTEGTSVGMREMFSDSGTVVPLGSSFTTIFDGDTLTTLVEP